MWRTLAGALGGSADDWWWTRWLYQRSLGVLYLVAFWGVVRQFRPLLGERGLLPVPRFVDAVPFRAAPSLFHFKATDRAFAVTGWLGVAFSLTAVTGVSDNFGMAWSVAVWALLWVLYLSFVNVGQTFYAFGWESILLEAGFLAVFLGPDRSAPPAVVMWLIVWLLFRVMFGAGLIKLRGDPCWRDLTALKYHYETQPLPNPLSRRFHYLPMFMHQAGGAFTLFVELLVPFAYFAPYPVAEIAGLLTIGFQLVLILSGNLSWLNWLTIVIAIPCFHSQLFGAPPVATAPLSDVRAAVLLVLALGTVVLSWKPVRNMASRRQLMNYCWNPLHLVCTYGAFGSVDRHRLEVLVEGSASLDGNWKPYEFRCKPGDPARRPCVVSPYHLRLDWLMWFLPKSEPWQHPWFFRFVERLLENDRQTLSLIAKNPFPERPPKYVRARLFLYKFSRRDDREAVWLREELGLYLPPLTRDPVTGQLEVVRGEINEPPIVGWGEDERLT